MQQVPKWSLAFSLGAAEASVESVLRFTSISVSPSFG